MDTVNLNLINKIDHLLEILTNYDTKHHHWNKNERNLVNSSDSDLIIQQNSTHELLPNVCHKFRNIILHENSVLTTTTKHEDVCAVCVLHLESENDVTLFRGSRIDMDVRGNPSDSGVGCGMNGGGASFGTAGDDGWNHGKGGTVNATSVVGSGGGSWGDFKGGHAGGSIYLQCHRNLVLHPHSSISANGQNGQDTEYVYASGAGSGGYIHIRCENIVFENNSNSSINGNGNGNEQHPSQAQNVARITCVGGRGGSGRCYKAGDGGLGRIIIASKTIVKKPNHIVFEPNPEFSKMHTSANSGTRDEL